LLLTPAIDEETIWGADGDRAGLAAGAEYDGVQLGLGLVGARSLLLPPVDEETICDADGDLAGLAAEEEYDGVQGTAADGGVGLGPAWA